MKYTNILPFREDEYVSKAAKTVDEAKGLVENGFEYVCDIEGVKIFRKRVTMASINPIAVTERY